MNSTTIELTGELTVNRLDEFCSQFSSELITTQCEFTLDCTELKYIDAALLQVIAALRLEAQHCGAIFRVKHVPDSILRDARLLGMETILLDLAQTVAQPRLGPGAR